MQGYFTLDPIPLPNPLIPPDLRRRRKALGPNQTEFGKTVSLSQRAAAAWETGEEPFGEKILGESGTSFTLASAG